MSKRSYDSPIYSRKVRVWYQQVNMPHTPDEPTNPGMWNTEGNLLVMAIALGLAGGVLIWDLLTPRGMAPQMLYMMVILVSAGLRYKPAVWLLALLCSGLTVLGAVLSQPRVDIDITVFNRLVTVGLIWLTAALVFLYLRAEERLRSMNLELERIVRQRTTELMQAFKHREQLARNLHDDVLQVLYATGLDLKTAAPMLQGGRPEATRQVEQTIGRLELAMQHLRNYIVGAQPAGGPSSLKTALAALICSMKVTAVPQLSLQVEEAADIPLSTQQNDHVLHVVREALSNCLRHSRATHAVVTVSRTNGVVHIEIRDDGIGFDPVTVGRYGHGLTNMAARADELGGRLHVMAAQGQGARLILQIPVAKERL